MRSSVASDHDYRHEVENVALSVQRTQSLQGLLPLFSTPRSSAYFTPRVQSDVSLGGSDESFYDDFICLDDFYAR